MVASPKIIEQRSSSKRSSKKRLPRKEGNWKSLAEWTSRPGAGVHICAAMDEKLLLFRHVQTRFRALQCVFCARVINLRIIALEALFGPVFGFLCARDVNFLR